MDNVAQMEFHSDTLTILYCDVILRQVHRTKVAAAAVGAAATAMTDIMTCHRHGRYIKYHTGRSILSIREYLLCNSLQIASHNCVVEGEEVITPGH